MSTLWVGVGSLLILVALGGAVAFPGSVYNTFVIAAPTVTCSTSNVCQAQVVVTNNNATEQARLSYQVAPDCGSCLAILSSSQAITSSAGSTQTFNLNLGALSCGAYILYMQVLAVAGQPIQGPLSYSQTVNFSPCLSLAIDPGGFNVAVSGNYPVISGSVNTQSQYAYNVPLGGQTSITASQFSASGNQYQFNCFLYVAGGSGCPTSNPLSLTMTHNIEILVQASPGPGFTYSTLTITAGLSGAGTTSPPAGQVTLYQNPQGGPSSVTVTATAKSGYYFQYWNLYASGSSQQITQNPVTVTYQQLGTQPGLLQPVYGQNPVLQVIDDQIYPGKVTLNPVPGNYPEAPNAQVAVTASGLPTSCTPSINACFYLKGWILDGQVVGQGQTSYTVSMNGAAHAISPLIAQTYPSGCTAAGGSVTTCVVYTTTTISCNPPPPAATTNTVSLTLVVTSTQCSFSGGGGGTGGSGSLLPFWAIVALAGVLMTVVGIRKKK